MTLDVKEILACLPHRYPLLLVDRVVEIEEGKRIVGIKNVTYNESYFQGHFPGNPVMPGVLLIEAMAQVGGILIAKSTETKGAFPFFVGIDKAKFRKPVVPGDQIRFEVEIIRSRSQYWKLKGKSFVDNQLAVEAQLLLAVLDS
ncbi:3-hydroxyacyl-ACP dehydratase FabZ [Acidobacteriota bacterium]